MNRYTTRRYVSTNWSDAIRLAQVDNTPISTIRMNEGVALLHRTDWWAWWSDERLTTSIGIPETLRPENLSADATILISDVWESNLLAPQCGWPTLAKVNSILSVEAIDIATLRNGVSACKWEKLTLLFEHRQQGLLYRYRCYDGSGYQCEIVYECPQNESTGHDD